jgi:hypothetical protein
MGIHWLPVGKPTPGWHGVGRAGLQRTQQLLC